MEVNREWKEKNKKYIDAMQIFLDKVSNIKEEGLKSDVINAMLQCDEILTILAIDEINKNKIVNKENNKSK